MTQAIVVGRDMGAAPPRQTEIRVRLPGTPDEQVRHALDAWRCAASFLLFVITLLPSLLSSCIHVVCILNAVPVFLPLYSSFIRLVHLPHLFSLSSSPCSAFGIPPMPDEAASILRASRPDGILLSVVTSSEGFVRVGIQAPKPSTDHVLRLCNVVRGNNEELAAFEGSLGAEGPSYVEYQHLVKVPTTPGRALFEKSSYSSVSSFF